MPRRNDSSHELRQQIARLQAQVQALEVQLAQKAKAETHLQESVQKLRTHQEELEIQNENLTMVQAELYPHMVSPASSLADIAAKILEYAKQLTASPHGYVAVIDPQSQEIVRHRLEPMQPVDCRRTEPDSRTMSARDKNGRYPGLWGESLNTGRAFYTNAPASHPASAGVPMGHIPLLRFLSMPVMLGETPVGQIALANKQSDYSDGDLEAIQRLAEVYALAIQRVRFVEQIKAALQEKEVLLQEIHHRVKNNMQVMRSLLNLQADSIEDPKLKSCLRESRARINAMAMIHETLYQSDSVSKLDLKTYIDNLAANLIRMYDDTAGRISLAVHSEPIYLPMDQAVPCGLVVNELIANAFKHAFPQNRRGEITIQAIRPDQNRVGLTVSDDGVGMPAGFDSQHSKGLGLKLVQGLVEVQLGGTIRHQGGPGTRIAIQFPCQSTGNGGS
jgi:two-component sensor histidine kinase